MKPRVCIYCGEPIPETGNALSRNLNLCASCSSLSDGMDQADTPKSRRPENQEPPAGESSTEVRKAA